MGVIIRNAAELCYKADRGISSNTKLQASSTPYISAVAHIPHSDYMAYTFTRDSCLQNYYPHLCECTYSSNVMTTLGRSCDTCCENNVCHSYCKLLSRTIHCRLSGTTLIISMVHLSSLSSLSLRDSSVCIPVFLQIG
jgi:hypothetical protein